MRKFEGKSLRKIAEITGHDFATIKKYIEKDDFNIKTVKKIHRKSKLSPYKDIVAKWLEDDLKSPYKQRHTAKRIHDRLKEIYPDEFNASERSVRKFVAKLRQELGSANEGFLPLTHPSGEAQVDFGEARFIENGKTYDGFYLNLSYPYSNAGYTQLFKSENQECLLEGIKSIFEYAGGTATSIWFDNMSTAVKKIKQYGKRDLTDGFLRFMLHYGFRSNFCNPGSGNEKGSVENKVGYHRRNLFVPVPEFKDLREYNRELLKRCDRDMDRMHYKGHGTIKDLFEEDKKEFLKLLKVPFDVYLHEFAKADNYGKVKFQGRIYSTAPNFAKRQVVLKAGTHEVEILDEEYNSIVAHRRLYGDEKESMNWVPYLNLMAKRPNALKYTDFFNMLPPVLKEYLDSLEHDSKKYTLRLLTKMTEDTGIDKAIEAFEESLKYLAKDPDSIWTIYCRLNSRALPDKEMNISLKVPELKKYVPDINIYDKFMNPGGLL